MAFYFNFDFFLFFPLYIIILIQIWIRCVSKRKTSADGLNVLGLLYEFYESNLWRSFSLPMFLFLGFITQTRGPVESSSFHWTQNTFHVLTRWQWECFVFPTKTREPVWTAGVSWSRRKQLEGVRKCNRKHSEQEVCEGSRKCSSASV